MCVLDFRNNKKNPTPALKSYFWARHGSAFIQLQHSGGGDRRISSLRSIVRLSQQTNKQKSHPWRRQTH
jgi:hypothetical protein